MKIIDIKDEDIINYKVTSMFIITSKCSFKCDKESGLNICQNSALAHSPIIDFDDERIVERYISNPISHAIVFGGLEPLDQFDELVALISKFRKKTKATIVIYTGYNEDEIPEQLKILSGFTNIIVKFGRFIPNDKHHKDKLLGVELASSNQYAKKLRREDYV